MSDRPRDPVMLGAMIWGEELHDHQVVWEMAALVTEPPEIMMPDMARRVLVLDHQARSRDMQPLRDPEAWRALVDRATEHGRDDLLSE